MVFEFRLVQINEATNNFSEENFVKRGGEGEVYRGEIEMGTSKAKMTVAVKRLSQDSNEFDKEIEMLRDLRHANLVSLQGFCKQNGNKILVYEYLHHGNLREKLQGNPPLTWMERLNICGGAARGIDHLHWGTSTDTQIIHRDIKPENILLDVKLNAKVSDFGISRKGTVNLDEQHMTEGIETKIAGTVGYYAPELCFNPNFTKRTDVYAFGALLFEVLCKKPPPLPKAFRDPDKKYEMDGSVVDLAWQHLDPDLKEPINETSIKSFIDITERCLSDDQYKRPTMSEVVFELQKAKQSLRAVLLKSVSQLPAPASAAPAAITGSDSCIAGDEDKVSVYHTSYTFVKKIRNDCRQVLSILEKYDQVEKRDVSQKELYRSQLQEAFGGKFFRLPQLFIGGRRVGGVDEILQLYESGELDELFEQFTA